MFIVLFLFQVNNGVDHWNGRFRGCFVCSWGEIYKLWMKYGGWEKIMMKWVVYGWYNWDYELWEDWVYTWWIWLINSCELTYYLI